MKNYFYLTFILFFMAIEAFPQSSKTILLVPGAGHGSWSWIKVTPLLKTKGYNVIELNLPGVGADTAQLYHVTLEDDVNSVVKVANSVKGKVILLGHSSGGAVISQTAEQLGPQKVDKLIFLDAFAPQDGESVLTVAERTEKENAKAATAQPDTTGPESRLFSKDFKSFYWNPELIDHSLYHDCSKEDINFAKAHLSWQAVATIATPLHLTINKYGAIKKYYILCTAAKDMDKSPMVSKLHFEKVYTLNSSHSPFFSMPGKLVDIIAAIN